jgi:hypothetical protein
VRRSLFQIRYETPGLIMDRMYGSLITEQKLKLSPELFPDLRMFQNRVFSVFGNRFMPFLSMMILILTAK